jgi:hypothetical protein
MSFFLNLISEKLSVINAGKLDKCVVVSRSGRKGKFNTIKPPSFFLDLFVMVPLYSAIL